MNTPRPCLLSHAQLRPDSCPICRRIVTKGKYAGLFGEKQFADPIRDLKPIVLPTVCPELGNPLREQPACGCAEKIRSCGIYDACTTGVVRAGYACCAFCPSKPERTARRHLLYHVYPLKTAARVWKWNLDQLKWRLDLFDGKRIVAVATGKDTNSFEEVKNHLGSDVTYVEADNDSVLREVATWPLLWDSLGAVGPADAVFLAHAKGVTRPVDNGVSIHRWASLLYETCLDYWPIVAELLVKYPLAGSCKKNGHGFQGSKSTWHYSGTFYWIRAGDAQGRWPIIDRVWWGTESWPGVHWGSEYGACIFHEGHVPTLDMYRLTYLKSVVLPKYFEWKAKNASRALYNYKRAGEYW